MPFSGFVGANYAPASSVLDQDTNLAFNPAKATVSYTAENTVDGNGIDVVYTITNVSATSIKPPKFKLNLGWNDTGADPLNRQWAGRHKWMMRTSPLPFSSANNAWFYGQVMAFNCMAWDNTTSDTIGCASDYPYVTLVQEDVNSAGATWKGIWIPLFTSANQVKVVPDWLRPGETKTFKFWLRRIPAVGLSASLSSVQPYIDMIKAGYPLRQGRKIYGRAQAYFLAGGGAGVSNPGPDGKYWRTINGKRVPDYSGWRSLIEAIVQQQGGLATYKARNYKAIVLWAVSGYTATGIDYLPSFYRNMVQNLKDTVDQVEEWVRDTGLEIWLWAGRTHSRVQLGAWNSPLAFPLSSGHYSTNGSDGPVFNPDNWGTWALKPEAQAEYTANVIAAAQKFRGLGLDADVSVAFDPWITEQYQRLKDAAPGTWYANEAQKTERTHAMSQAYYFPPYGDPQTKYEGHCPLMEAIYPKHQNAVHVYASDISHSWNDRVTFIEGQGDFCIVQGYLADAPYTGLKPVRAKNVVSFSGVGQKPTGAVKPSPGIVQK